MFNSDEWISVLEACKEECLSDVIISGEHVFSKTRELFTGGFGLYK